jgi:hypothetical protein
MGCDIHLYTERKQSINSVEKWVNIDNWKLNPYFSIDEEDKYKLSPAFRIRDYRLFAILADVRNDCENIPISEPKGIPEDASEVVKSEIAVWDGDGHSHSFFTMKELYDYYENNKIIKFKGLTDAENAVKIDNGEMPEWWCMASTNKSYIYKEWTFENYTMKNLIERLETHFKSEYYDKERDSEKFRIVFFFDN